jgi:flagellar hook assembly protein FlgD
MYAIGAHPNPFNPMTTLTFSLPRPGKAEVRIYSLRGELVERIGGDVYEAGRHEVMWRGKDRRGQDAPSGSYFAKLYVDGKGVGPVTKMSLVR